jgi:hypothetical protein
MEKSKVTILTPEALREAFDSMPYRTDDWRDEYLKFENLTFNLAFTDNKKVVSCWFVYCPLFGDDEPKPPRLFSIEDSHAISAIKNQIPEPIFGQDPFIAQKQLKEYYDLIISKFDDLKK